MVASSKCLIALYTCSSMDLPHISHEAAARWLYALGTSVAATVATVEIGPTLSALLLAVAHVAAAALVAYARRPRIVRVRRDEAAVARYQRAARPKLPGIRRQK